MPIITGLQGAVSNANRVNVFIDGKFSFSLTISELADSKLARGQDLTEEEIKKYRTLSCTGKLYQQALEYCFSRPHSKKEIIDFLKRKKMRRELAWQRYENFQDRMQSDKDYAEAIKEFKKSTREKNQKIRETDFTENNTYEYRGTQKTNLPTKPADRIDDEMIDLVITRLESQNIINDLLFARYYIENRNRSKGISRRKLLQELKQKGISDDIISEAFISDITGEVLRDEAEEIQKMVKKQLKKTTDRNKIIAHLARQGFSYDLIKTTLDHILQEDTF